VAKSSDVKCDLQNPREVLIGLKAVSHKEFCVVKMNSRGPVKVPRSKIKWTNGTNEVEMPRGKSVGADIEKPRISDLEVLVSCTSEHVCTSVNSKCS
jgi:hypothetical protein